MRRLSVAATCLLVLLASAASLAQERAEVPTGRKPPAPARGFQMAVVFGWAVPTLRASGAPGDSLAARYSSQFAADLELGGKPIDRLYVGGYAGLSLGFEGSDSRVVGMCDDKDTNAENDIACASGTFRAGLQAQVSLAPGAFWNPWLGYGIGYEWAWQNLQDGPRRRSETTWASGLQFARLSFGVDYRAHRAIGVGPMLELALGRYSNTRTEVNSIRTYDGPTPDPEVHAWLMLGVRTVIFP